MTFYRDFFSIPPSVTQELESRDVSQMFSVLCEIINKDGHQYDMSEYQHKQEEN